MNPLSTLLPKIQIYCDTAEHASIFHWMNTSLVRGFTTNPSLIRKAGALDYRKFCQEILSKVKVHPISFEVFADDFSEMEKQAHEIASWGNNVYVKIPITNSQGESSLPLIRRLNAQGISLNITAIYTLKQVIGTCEALRERAPALVSVFAGRMADTGKDPLPLMQASLEVCRSYGSSIQLLWASCREVFNMIQADQCGCDIITAPPEMIQKLTSLGKNLDQLSLETVQAFRRDAEAAGFSL